MEVASWERVLQTNLHGPCVLALSHALHTELRPAGIEAAAVVAGGLLTPFLLDRFPDIDRMTLQDQDQANVAFAICSVLELQAVTVVPESLLRHEAQRQLDLVASLGCRLASIRLGLRIGAAEFDAATGDSREGITRRAVNSARRCCDCRFSCSFGSH